MYLKRASMIAAVLVLSGAGFLAWAGDDKDKQALQGSWKAVGGDKGGRSIEFKGNKFVLTFRRESKDKSVESVNGTFTIDPAKNPKTIDMLVSVGTAKEFEKYQGKTALAIYELEGNKLKWCANEPGQAERPKAFPQKEGPSKLLFVVFEREKK